MFSFLKTRTEPVYFQTDLHSHLIPGIDDGVKSWEESLFIVRSMSDLGIKRMVTTPHIITDYYPNIPKNIRIGVEELNERLIQEEINVKIIAGAEYYVDEHFLNQIKNGDELLSFGPDYILIETAFINKPIFLEEVFFELKSRGLNPILAHPERYQYVQEDPSIIKTYCDLDVKMQINASSLTGYYSKPAQKTAEILLSNGTVHFIGSDIHHMRHFETYKKVIRKKSFRRSRQLGLLNDTL